MAGIWEALSGASKRQKGRLAWQGEDGPARDMFGREGPKKGSNGGKFELTVDKTKIHEIDGQQYYQVLEKSKRTGNKEEPTIEYMPVKEFDGSSGSSIPDWKKKKAITTVEIGKAKERNAYKEIPVSRSEQKSTPGTSGDRGSEPLAAFRY